METKYSELQEKQARANALQIALRQTQDAAIAHLECVVGAILAAMSTTNKAKVQTELANIERLSPEVLKTAQLFGEVDDGVIPQRQKWREELAALTIELETAHTGGD